MLKLLFEAKNSH